MIIFDNDDNHDDHENGNRNDIYDSDKNDNEYKEGYYITWIYQRIGAEKNGSNFHMTFSNAFYCMKIYQFVLKFHWSLFLSVRLTDRRQAFVWASAG